MFTNLHYWVIIGLIQCNIPTKCKLKQVTVRWRLLNPRLLFKVPFSLNHFRGSLILLKPLLPIWLSWMMIDKLVFLSFIQFCTFAKAVQNCTKERSSGNEENAFQFFYSLKTVHDVFFQIWITDLKFDSAIPGHVGSVLHKFPDLITLQMVKISELLRAMCIY